MLASRKLNQAQSNALRHYNSPLDAMRMLFTTENNGCVWKYTSDAYSAFQASEINASVLILSSCVFIYLLPPHWHHEMVDICCKRESRLPLTTLTFHVPLLQMGCTFEKVSPSSFPEMQEI